MVMCIYEKLANESVNKNSEEYKMISDIRDAVEFLTESKFERKSYLICIKRLKNLKCFIFKRIRRVTIKKSKRRFYRNVEIRSKIVDYCHGFASKRKVAYEI